MGRSGVEQPTTSSVTKLVASKELVRIKIAVDMIDIAQGLTRSSRTRAGLQNLAGSVFNPLLSLGTPHGREEKEIH